MLTISAEAVAAAAPKIPMPIRHTDHQSPNALTELATKTTPKGVAESLAPRHAACNTIAAIEAGAPIILTLEYSSAAGMTYHSRDGRGGGHGKRKTREKWVSFA